VYVALGLAAIMSPAALLALTMAFWRIASDLRWTGTFIVASGIFSHWQTWLAVAAALFLLASALNRIGRGAGALSYKIDAPSVDPR
jgi:hypothetical protein